MNLKMLNPQQQRAEWWQSEQGWERWKDAGQGAHTLSCEMKKVLEFDAQPEW